MRIGARLAGGFLAVVGLIVGVGLIALYDLGQVAARYERALDHCSRRAAGGLRLEVAVLELVRLQKNYLLRGEADYLEEARVQAQRVRAAHAELKAAASPTDRELFAELDAALGALEQAFQANIPVRRAQGISAADRIMRGKAEHAVRILDRLVVLAQGRARQERDLALSQARRTRAITIAVFAGILLIAVGLAAALSLSVTRPLQQLRSQIDAVAAGAPIPSAPAAAGRDEVGQIARAFHGMMQRTALLREMETRSKRLEVLSSRVARAQEEEREVIARELHDGLGQALTAIKLGLSAASRSLGDEAAAAKEQLAAAQRLADESLDELRQLVFDLRPPALDNLGLVAALESYVRRFRERTGIEVVLEADAFEPRLPFQVETALYRISQEALNNIAKHARASRAIVRLANERDQVVLIVSDNGAGFDPAAIAEADGTPRGVGLLSMERRAQELGGTFDVQSVAGVGTRVLVEVPMQPSQGAT